MKPEQQGGAIPLDLKMYKQKPVNWQHLNSTGLLSESIDHQKRLRRPQTDYYKDSIKME